LPQKAATLPLFDPRVHRFEGTLPRNEGNFPLNEAMFLHLEGNSDQNEGTLPRKDPKGHRKEALLVIEQAGGNTKKESKKVKAKLIRESYGHSE
jgi:hypothetical protein